MNIHSFIFVVNNEMARKIDINKVERLKQTTMKLVVENGYGGASASLIAKEAKIATGYFYLHYKGKYEMVNAIFQEVFQDVYTIFEDMFGKHTIFSEIVETLIHYFIDLGNVDPIRLKFMYVLTNDYSFVIDRHLKEDIYKVILKLKEMGNDSGCIDPNITEDDLYLILVINTIQFINQRFKSNKGAYVVTESEEQHLLYLVNKIIKK